MRHFPRVAGQQSLKGLAKWARISSRCARELVALRLVERLAAAASRGPREASRGCPDACSASLTTAFTIGLVYFNLLGLTLVALRWTSSYALARVAAPAAVALRPSSSSTSSVSDGWDGAGRSPPRPRRGSIATRRQLVLDHLGTEALFLLAFAWALAWRLSFPGIVASSEKIGDLAMIMSYMPGDRLPPTDAWYPPYPFDIYYSFQHYGAALLGRIFGLDPGTTYNLAFAVADRADDHRSRRGRVHDLPLGRRHRAGARRVRHRRNRRHHPVAVHVRATRRSTAACGSSAIPRGRSSSTRRSAAGWCSTAGVPDDRGRQAAVRNLRLSHRISATTIRR